MVMNDMPTALARWDDEGGSVALRAHQNVAVGRDSLPLPKAVPPLGLYQRATLRRSYDAFLDVRAPRGLFCEEQDPSAKADKIRT